MQPLGGPYMMRRVTLFNLNVFVVVILSVSACGERPATPLSPSVTATTTSTPLVSSAKPQEIRISRGTFVQAADLTGRFDIGGTQGVEMEGTVSPHTASLPWEFCLRIGCEPGTVVDLRSGYGTRPPFFTGSGQVTLRGQTYSLWTGDEAFADFRFDGSVTLPALPATGSVEVSTPFVFSGSLYVPSRLESGTYDVYALRGSGVATVLITRHPFGAPGVAVGAITFNFEPRGDAIPR